MSWLAGRGGGAAAVRRCGVVRRAAWLAGVAVRRGGGWAGWRAGGRCAVPWRGRAPGGFACRAVWRLRGAGVVIGRVKTCGRSQEVNRRTVNASDRKARTSYTHEVNKLNKGLNKLESFSTIPRQHPVWDIESRPGGVGVFVFRAAWRRAAWLGVAWRGSVWLGVGRRGLAWLGVARRRSAPLRAAGRAGGCGWDPSLSRANQATRKLKDRTARVPSMRNRNYDLTTLGLSYQSSY